MAAAAQVRAADEARIAREAEEQSLQEQKEEHRRLQREIEEITGEALPQHLQK